VNVFWRADGQCLFDDAWGPGDLPSVAPGSGGPERPAESTSTASRPPLRGRTSKNLISASTVWSLVQVFVQFAREVDGGNIQRLVFRDAALPVGKRRAFGAVSGGVTSGPRPAIVHVAHDPLFVVTVTESLRTGASDLYRSESQDAAISAFAHAVLRYVALQEETFLRSRGPQGNGEHDGSSGHSRDKPPQTTRQVSRIQNAPRGHSNGGRRMDAVEPREGSSLAPQQTQLEQHATYRSSSSGTSFVSQGSSDSFSGSTSATSSEAASNRSAVGTPMMPFDLTQISRQVHRIRALHEL
jgi:hypothetical protein